MFTWRKLFTTILILAYPRAQVDDDLYEIESMRRFCRIRFGYAKNRYRGLAKNTARLTFLTANANVIRGDAYECRRLIASKI